MLVYVDDEAFDPLLYSCNSLDVSSQLITIIHS